MMAASLVRSDYGKNPSVIEVGQVIDGKYKLLRLLGDGGMGSVYEAEHLALGTHVAIKVLHSDLSRRPGLIDRFLQEARVSAQIRSPHVVHVTDFAHSSSGAAYLVMELLQGEPLSTVVKRERKLSIGTACEYTLQILQALEAAHALGVIHRDLKPDNVFVTFEGGKPVLKLIDFGIAKLKRAEGAGTKNLTVAGTLMGTPEYMAPEQAYSADKVDVRADLYSVGVMLYEMLSGATPVTGDDPRVVILKIERGEVTPLVHAAPGLKPELAGFVHRAMAPKPELRFATATEMRLALEALVSGKRPQTAQLPHAQGGAGGAAGLAFAETSDARPGGQELGTGTVMGAPAQAALAPSGFPPAHDGQRTGTVRAAPIAAPGPAAYGAPPVQATPPPVYEATHPPRRTSGGNKGLVVALAIIATLLGAGAVVAYVASTGAFDSSTPTAQPTFTTPETPTTATTPGTQAPPTAVTTSTPLTPPPPVTTVTPPHTAPRPSGSAAPHPSGSAAPSNQPPPFPFPSGMPSNLPPFPSGFPSAIPLPSGFPTFFPPPPPPNN
jgi:serine/threonine-protein kinase